MLNEPLPQLWSAKALKTLSTRAYRLLWEWKMHAIGVSEAWFPENTEGPFEVCYYQMGKDSLGPKPFKMLPNWSLLRYRWLPGRNCYVAMEDRFCGGQAVLLGHGWFTLGEYELVNMYGDWVMTVERVSFTQLARMLNDPDLKYDSLRVLMEKIQAWVEESSDQYKIFHQPRHAMAA